MRNASRIALDGLWLAFWVILGGSPALAQTAVNAQSQLNVTPTDCSLTLSSGGTAQNIITAGNRLHGFCLMNIDNTHGSGEPVWISFTTTASAGASGSFALAAPVATTYAFPGSFCSPVGFGINTNVSVVAATTSHVISCTRW